MSDRTPTGCVRARFIFTALICWVSMASMCLQMNLNLSIVAMVNQTAVHSSRGGRPPSSPEGDCSRPDPPPDRPDSKSRYEGGEFLWGSSLQGLLLGAVFFGYVVSHAPAGLLAQRFPCKRLMFVCALCSSVLALLTPSATREGGPALLFALRTVQGFFMGMILPLTYSMVSRWTPVLERSVTLSLSYVGGVMGTSSTLMAAGFLTSHDPTDGWTHVFYLTGAFGCLFSLVWFLLAHDTPEQHPTISEKEFRYIMESLGREQSVEETRRSIPWRSAASSVPLWSLALVRCTGSWGVYLVQTAVPLYLQTALHVPLELNGIMSGVMFLSSAVSCLLCGLGADVLRKRFSTTFVRKAFTTLAYGGSAVCWVAVSRVGCSPTAAFLCFLTAKFFLAAHIAGDYAAIVDMAPTFAGPLSGILFTLSDSIGFVCPLVTGVITEREVSLERWRRVFDLCAGLLLVGAVQFLLFGSAEVQPWAKGRSGKGSPPDESTSLLSREETTHSSETAESGKGSGVPKPSR